MASSVELHTAYPLDYNGALAAMKALGIVYRAVFAVSVATHAVAVIVLVAPALYRGKDVAWHFHYFAAMLCALWLGGAIVFALKLRRAPRKPVRSPIPAALMWPCSFGILVIGLPNADFALVSSLASALFVSATHSAWLSAAANITWGTAFGLYHYGSGNMQLLPAQVLLVTIIVVANVVVRELVRDGETREKLLGQAQWSAARLPALTLSLDRAIQQSRLEAAAEERTKLAQLLHDSTGYALTATVVQLNTLRELMKEPALAKRIEVLEDLVRRTNRDVKQQVSQLREAQSLPGETNWHQRWRQLCAVFADCTGVIVRADIDNINRYVAGEVGEVIYRAIQESLTNAYRHGQATVISVTVRLNTARSIMMMKISDNGVGAAKPIPGNGLKGIVSRVEKHRGSVRWDTRPGKGFDIGIDLPVLLGNAGGTYTVDHS